MTLASDYEVIEPSRAEIDELQGAALLEFGSPRCGFCLRAEPLVREALAGHPNVRHIKIADGRGQRLGRSFHVKLWPTLVFLKDGKEVSRLVRPGDRANIRRAMAGIDRAA
jgi:thioredoxin 1